MKGRQIPSRETLSWLGIAAFWPVVGVAFMSVGLFSDPGTFDLRDTRQLFLDWMTWVEWSLFTVPILLIAGWIRRHTSAPASISLHLVVAICFTLLHLTTYMMLIELVRGPGPADLLSLAAQRLPRHLMYNPLIYGAIVLAGYAIHQYWHREAGNHEKILMERLVAEAELGLLRAQLQPTFIVATLGAISRLVEEDSARAEDAILRLSDFLRLCLKRGERPSSTVEEEVVVVRAYLDVLNVASPAGHDGRVVVDDSALQCPMPPAFLQVLVDYALEISERKYFTLEIVRQVDRLSVRMEIETVSEGLTSSPALTAVQSVLTRAYGSRFELNHRFEEGSTQLEFTLPVPGDKATPIPGFDVPSVGDRLPAPEAFRVPELQR